MSKNSPTAGGPAVPNSGSVLRRQRLSRAAALLPVTSFLPLMLLGMHLRHLPPEQAQRAGGAEHIRLLRRDLRATEGRAAYWRAAARRNGGDARLALRARRWSGKVAWQTKHLAAFRP